MYLKEIVLENVGTIKNIEKKMPFIPCCIHRYN